MQNATILELLPWKEITRSFIPEMQEDYLPHYATRFFDLRKHSIDVQDQILKQCDGDLIANEGLLVSLLSPCHILLKAIMRRANTLGFIEEAPCIRLDRMASKTSKTNDGNVMVDWATYLEEMHEKRSQQTEEVIVDATSHIKFKRKHDLKG